MIVRPHAGEARRIWSVAAGPIDGMPRPIGEIIAELLDRYSDTLTMTDKLTYPTREGQR